MKKPWPALGHRTTGENKLKRNVYFDIKYAGMGNFKK
jgi:hypothetical protein